LAAGWWPALTAQSLTVDILSEKDNAVFAGQKRTEWKLGVAAQNNEANWLDEPEQIG